MNWFRYIWNIFKKNEEDKAEEAAPELPKKEYRKRLDAHRVRLVKYLLSKGHTQTDVAEFVGTTQPRVSDIANGKRWSSIVLEKKHNEELHIGHQLIVKKKALKAKKARR